MYIGPQGIVHGTTITVLNAFRKIKKSPKGGLFVTSGLGGMSGAQPKAGNIAGCITVCAEVNPKITKIRHEQKWVDEIHENLDELVSRVRKAQENNQTVSLAYLGNVVEVWEEMAVLEVIWAMVAPVELVVNQEVMVMAAAVAVVCLRH
jgi:urocanate hydratase